MIFLSIIMWVIVVAIAMTITAFLLGAVFGPSNEEDYDKSAAMALGVIFFPFGLVAVIIGGMFIVCTNAYKAGASK